MRRLQLGRRLAASLFALAFAVGLGPFVSERLAAEEMVDLTLLFHSAVQGKIAPCG
jgi:hypothetical protein